MKKLKVNFQKISSLAIAFVLIIFICAVPVFADDSSEGLNSNEYLEQYYSLLDSYLEGEIDWSTYHTSSNALIDQYTNDNTIDGVVTNAAAKIGRTSQAVNNKIGDLAQTYGDSALDKIKDVLDETTLLPYKVTKTKTANPFTHASVPEGGCAVKSVSYTGSFTISVSEGPGTMYSTFGNMNYSGITYVYSSDGTLAYEQPFDANSFSKDSSNTFYGTWINASDGTPAETDDTFYTEDGYDFSQATDNDLIDLLNDILEALENENPDLSSVEDILKAIYYKLKQMEDKGNSDITLGDLDSLINSAVNRLISEQNKHECDHTGIIKALEDIKGDTNLQEIYDKLNEIYPAFDYDTEVENIESIKTAFLAKWGFVEELKTLIERFMSSYEKHSGLTTADNVIHVKYSPKNGTIGNLTLNASGAYDISFEAFDEYLPTFRSLLAAFIYISYAWRTYRKIPSYISGGDAE